MSDQPRSLKRKTEPLSIPECEAPILLAHPSARFALSVREQKVDLSSEAAVSAMLVDMVVDESGKRRFSLGEVHEFLGDISATSMTALMNKCFEMFSAGKGGAPGNSQPSTST